MEDAEPLDESALEEAYQAALDKLAEAEHEIDRAFRELTEELPAPAPTPATVADGAADTADLEHTAVSLLQEFDEDAESSPTHRISPRQVVEAALFVGGEPVTAKKLCSVLKRESDHEFIERQILKLNQLYFEQNRPYEIRLEEGGYRLELRSEFDAVRNQVFGLGPKDVKLSQEALEVLSFVAYRQPATRQDLEESGPDKSAAILRQLLRRDLVALERGESASDITYRTTARFLELFGLGDLEELPLADDFEFK